MIKQLILWWKTRKARKATRMYLGAALTHQIKQARYSGFFINPDDKSKGQEDAD